MVFKWVRFLSITYHHFAFMSPDCGSKPLIGFKFKRLPCPIHFNHPVIWTKERGRMKVNKKQREGLTCLINRKHQANLCHSLSKNMSHETAN